MLEYVMQMVFERCSQSGVVPPQSKDAARENSVLLSRNQQK